MSTRLTAIWNEDDGVLSFEWVILTTLVVGGVVGGLAAARDAVTDELGDVAQAMQAVDQTYTIDFPLQVQVHAATTSSASDSSFIDALIYSDCDRAFGPFGDLSQDPVVDDFDS